MDKRVLLTVAICMGILFVWTNWFMPKPQPATAPAQAPSTAASPAPATPSSTAATAPAASPAPAAAVVEKPKEVITPVEDLGGKLRAGISNWGAALAEWKLLDDQYKAPSTTNAKQMVPIDLVPPGKKTVLTSFEERELGLDVASAWELAKQVPNREVAYVFENQRVRVTKHYRFQEKSYQFKLEITVENKGEQPLAEHLQLTLVGWQDPNVKPGGMFTPGGIQTIGACHANGKLKRGDLAELLKEPISAVGQVRWVGIDQKFFVSALATTVGAEQTMCKVQAWPDGNVQATLSWAERKIAPREKTTYELAGFFGPKVLAQLDAVSVGGQDPKLGHAVDYGMWEVLARPMLAVLKAIFIVIPNWGLAVIFLTILIKALTWWPTTKSMKSMKEMAKLKPEMDKIKIKYPDDKNKQNQAVMELYKKHGINPLGGCLPMLIQMPIYIALYSMLGNSVELYRSGFVGWIRDLTAPDPYFVLPLLTGVLMFAQQKLSPTPPDANQKAMMYMMPVMFTAFSIFLPAGLTVYILTNTVLTMVQQWWMNRHEPKAVPAKA